MIQDQETFEKYHYYPFNLSLHSEKPILAACDKCSKVRTTSKNNYRSLCKSCALIGRPVTEETKAKISASEKGKKGLIGENNPMWKPKIRCTCLQCCKQFFVFPSDIKNRRCKFCTKECADKAKEGAGGTLWRNGISFEPYCIKFNNKYKNHIRNLFGNECFLCSLSQLDNGKNLSVHHVNYNKDCGCDETKCICVPLCIKCHAKTGIDRDFWQALIMEMLQPTEAWT